MKILLIKVTSTILIVAAIYLRTTVLGKYPLFHADEMAFGYGAYSYLQSGQDEFGKSMGIVWESVGDYKLTSVVYATIPFIALGGLNEFTTRIPSVIWGLGSVMVLYLLTKKFLHPKIALLSALLMLLSPWHILFSRTSNEAILLLFLTLAGLYLYTKARETHHLWYAVMAALVLSIAVLTYYAAFMYIPLLTLTFYLCTQGWKKSKWYLLPVIVVALTNALFLATQPLGRVNQTNIFSSDLIQNRQLQLLSNQDTTSPPLVTRILYNKYALTFSQLTHNLLDHFTYTFLFSKGDFTPSRYSLPNMGPLFSWQLPFLLFGAVLSSIRLRKNPVYVFILASLIVAVMPNSLSVNGPVTQRTLNMLPPLLVLTAIGLYETYNYLKKYSFATGMLSIALFPIIAYQGLFFLNDFFIQMPRTRPDLRQGFANETIQKINELAPQYKKTYVTDGGMYISHFFYNQTNPTLARTLMNDRQYTAANYIVLSKTENVNFMNIDCPSIGKKDILFVCKGEYIPQNTKLLHIIRHPNGHPARIFLTFIDPPQGEMYLPDKLKLAKEGTQELGENDDYGEEIKKEEL